MACPITPNPQQTIWQQQQPINGHFPVQKEFFDYAQACPRQFEEFQRVTCTDDATAVTPHLLAEHSDIGDQVVAVLHLLQEGQDAACSQDCRIIQAGALLMHSCMLCPESPWPLKAAHWLTVLKCWAAPYQTADRAAPPVALGQASGVLFVFMLHGGLQIYTGRGPEPCSGQTRPGSQS